MQFTVRHMMTGVLVAAGVLALWRTFGVVGVVVVGLTLPFSIGWGAIFRGNRHRAARGFTIAAAAMNLVIAELDARFPHMLTKLLMACMAFFLVPMVLGFGSAWAVAATAPGAPRRWSPYLAWPIVLALSFAPMTMIATSWPVWISFLTARPALERMADRVQAGEVIRTPEMAGCYLIVGSAVTPEGEVALIIDNDPNGRYGFVRLHANTPGRDGPLHNFAVDLDMGGRWRFQGED